MTVTVDPRVRWLRRVPTGDDPALPPVAAPRYRPGLIDVVGSAICRVSDRGRAVAAAATADAPQRVPVSGSSADVPASTSTSLRVVTFNVHGGMGGSGQFVATPAKLDRLAAAIADLDPDVLLLQELDQFAVRSNFVDTAAALVRRLQPCGAVTTTSIQKVYGRREGTGILTFHGIRVTSARGLRIGDALGDGVARRARSTAAMLTDAVGRRWGLRQRWLPSTVEYQPRGATDAMLVCPSGAVLRVLSGHFSGPHDGVDEPARQVMPLLDLLRGWSGPAVVGADFNVRDGSADIDREHRWFADAGFAEATAGAPVNSDRIYASGHFVSGTPRKVSTADGAPAPSDHDPVVVDVSFTDPTPGPPLSSRR